MDSSTQRDQWRDVWMSRRTSLISLLTEVDAEAHTTAYAASGTRPRDPIQSDADLAQLVAIRRLRESALAVEDLALAAMMHPGTRTPSVEVVGEALGMSRQGARKRIKTARARVDALAESGPLVDPGGATTESSTGGGLDPVRELATAVGVLDALSAVLVEEGVTTLANKIATCAEDLARYAALHPGADDSEMARAEIGNDWAYRIRGALHSTREQTEGQA